MKKTLFIISGFLFTLIFLLHLLRLAYSIEVQIGAWVVPHWVSYPALLFFGFLSILNWRAALKN
ncbi:MAG: hypothetical protein L0196_03460 [candidate division Zixibacteria bacterium]|nr:hypothetical protein [candidate division Zixibacteria bacterium]